MSYPVGLASMKPLYPAYQLQRERARPVTPDGPVRTLLAQSPVSPSARLGETSATGSRGVRTSASVAITPRAASPAPHRNASWKPSVAADATTAGSAACRPAVASTSPV